MNHLLMVSKAAEKRIVPGTKINGVYDAVSVYVTGCLAQIVNIVRRNFRQTTNLTRINAYIHKLTLLGDYLCICTIY